MQNIDLDEVEEK